jgi:hypothetical protein
MVCKSQGRYAWCALFVETTWQAVEAVAEDITLDDPCAEAAPGEAGWKKGYRAIVLEYCYLNACGGYIMIHVVFIYLYQ